MGDNVLKPFQGDTFDFKADILDGSQIKDLSDFDVYFTLRDKQGGDIVLKKKGKIINPHKGEVKFHLTSEETDIEYQGYTYSIVIKSESEIKTVAHDSFIPQMR